MRRVVTVLLIYVVAALAVLVLGEWLRRLLVLPMIFETLLRAGVYLGALVAAVLAWHYPRLATGSDGRSDPDAAGRRHGRDPDGAGGRRRP